jgi:hypothetical protein
MDALANLEELDLSDNKIEEIKNLEHLSKLKKLNLFRNKIKKLEGLEKLTELKFLDLRTSCYNLRSKHDCQDLENRHFEKVDLLKSFFEQNSCN